MRRSEIAAMADVTYETLRTWTSFASPRSAPLASVNLLAWRLGFGCVELRQPRPEHKEAKLLVVQQLREERKRLKVRINELCDAVRVGPATLARWETSNDKGPTLHELDTWATSLGYPGITLSVPVSPLGKGVVDLATEIPDEAVQAMTIDPAWFVPRTDEWLDLQRRAAAYGVDVDLFKNVPAYRNPKLFKAAFKEVYRYAREGADIYEALDYARRTIEGWLAKRAAIPANTLDKQTNM